MFICLHISIYLFICLCLFVYIYIFIFCINSISHSFPSHFIPISQSRWIVNYLAAAMLEATARVMMRPWVALLDRTFSGWRRWAAPPRGGRWIGMMIDPWVGWFDVRCHPRLVAKRVFFSNMPRFGKRTLGIYYNWHCNFTIVIYYLISAWYLRTCFISYHLLCSWCDLQTNPL